MIERTRRPLNALRAALWLLACASAAGCAQHRVAAAPGTASSEAAAGTLENYLGQVRHLSSTVRPAPAIAALTLERHDPELLAALAVLAAEPTAAHHRLVAEAYAKNGVLDAAYDHFIAATRLAPRDAAAYAGLARVWRDWGFPQLGLADAHRAVFYAPGSASAKNTLATLLLKLGLPAQAHIELERARLLDPRAAYISNNLCYAALLQGLPAEAIRHCGRAIALQPGLTAARNNLALAYAAAGDLDSAALTFSGLPDQSDASYNLGVALLVLRHYSEAARAFDHAVLLRPAFARARERAVEARALARRTMVAPDMVGQ